MTQQTAKRTCYSSMFAVMFALAAIVVMGSVWTSNARQSELPDIRIDVLAITMSGDNGSLPDLTVKEPF